MLRYLLEQTRQRSLLNQQALDCTPFLIACEQGHEEAAEFLLDSKADCESTRTDGAGALFLAAQKGRLSVVRFLYRRIGLHRTWRRSLRIACQNFHFTVAQLLIDQRAEVGREDLLSACAQGNDDVVRVLLDTKPGAGMVNAANNLGQTPMYVACAAGWLPLQSLAAKSLACSRLTELYVGPSKIWQNRCALTSSTTAPNAADARQFQMVSFLDTFLGFELSGASKQTLTSLSRQAAKTKKAHAAKAGGARR